MTPERLAGIGCIAILLLFIVHTILLSAAPKRVNWITRHFNQKHWIIKNHGCNSWHVESSMMGHRHMWHGGGCDDPKSFFSTESAEKWIRDNFGVYSITIE